ncbi:MAG: hypothetical protein GX815_09975, partial [Clostridiales bacterium]|nr:hypothetical protein [Clostridiales bacterium]
KEADVGVFISSHLLSEMELMCDRIYIIDNGVIIGEKDIHQEEESVEDITYQYTFVTDNNTKLMAYFNALQYSSVIENGGVNVVLSRNEIPNIVAQLVQDDFKIYAVNQKHRTLEQDFLSMTSGTKTQIR